MPITKSLFFSLICFNLFVLSSTKSIYNQYISESGSGSGSGSGDEIENQSGNDDEIENENDYYLFPILFSLSPLICAGGCLILAFIYIGVMGSCVSKYNNIKYKIKIYFEENSLPIQKSGLSKNFVKKLNNQNFGQIKGESNQQECSICIETINLDKQKKDIVVLNCGHIFHKRCIDKWAINTPNCPMCRKNICDVEVNKLYININYNSDSDSSRDWMDDL